MTQKHTQPKSQINESENLIDIARQSLGSMFGKLLVIKGWIYQESSNRDDLAALIIRNSIPRIERVFDIYNRVSNNYKLIDKSVCQNYIDYLNKIFELLTYIEAILSSADLALEDGDERKIFCSGIANLTKEIRDDVAVSTKYIVEKYEADYIPDENRRNVTLKSNIVMENKLSAQIREILNQQGVPDKNIEHLVWKFVLEINASRANLQRPMWKDRHEHGLSDVTATDFLKQVHADAIKDGVVYEEHIRAIDKDLMDAVDSYISQREKRGLTLERAQDLEFIASRPAPRHRAEIQLEENELAEFRLHAQRHPWVTGKGLSPSAFISETFKTWLGKGLLREHIKEVLPKLASAYSVEVSRHPDRRLPGLGTRPHTRHGTSLEGEELTSSGWIKNEDLHPDQVAARRRAQALVRRQAKAHRK